MRSQVKWRMLDSDVSRIFHCDSVAAELFRDIIRDTFIELNHTVFIRLKWLYLCCGSYLRTVDIPSTKSLIVWGTCEALLARSEFNEQAHIINARADLLSVAAP